MEDLVSDLVILTLPSASLHSLVTALGYGRLLSSVFSLSHNPEFMTYNRKTTRRTTTRRTTPGGTMLLGRSAEKFTRIIRSTIRTSPSVLKYQRMTREDKVLSPYFDRDRDSFRKCTPIFYYSYFFKSSSEFKKNISYNSQNVVVYCDVLVVDADGFRVLVDQACFLYLKDLPRS